VRHKLLVLLTVVTVTLTPFLFQGGSNTTQSDATFDSPLPTPPASPTPTPSAPSAEAQKALQYIAERESIPLEGLLIINDYEWVFPLLGRTFRDVLILDIRTSEGQEYHVLVDLADGHIEDDWNAIEAAEEAAYRDKYGKLHPALYERMQKAGDDDLLPVAIWTAPNAQVRTRQEVYAELAARYPKAAVALEREGTPWAVDDPVLAQEIHEEYRRMRAEDTAVRVEPLVEYLSERDFEARTFGAMPSVSAVLPTRVIVELAERDDVGIIYLIEEQGSDESDTAIPTDRVPIVWQRGFDGSDVRIAILEDGNIDDDVDCLEIVATRISLQGEDDHKTRVASVAACDDDTYTGVAPAAQIIDAGFDSTGWGASQEDAVEALTWAIQYPQSADAVNLSYGWGEDNNLNWTDRAFDYWAREERVIIVKSAGNIGGSITSPGKAWNVITVGGSDDNQTSAWSDDEMWDDSSYVNPVGIHREKPEVVAPAVVITAISTGAVPITRTGTSYAAPQVAGLAALLIDRNDPLSIWPTAVKAIIMASAVHNIFGPSDIPTGYDLRDGAGAIDAALADEIAKNRSFSSTTPCDSPCWWGITTSSSNPSVGGSLYRYFNASRGERVRVAISWFSNADPPLDYPDLARDELDTNYNLHVYAPSDALVGYTASDDNNYELVEFIALETGKYKIRVYRSSLGDNDEDSNHLGIAWVKDATYLPDLRNKDGWVSEFYVRNDSNDPGTLRHVQIHYFDANGNPTPKGSDECILIPNQWCWIPVNVPIDDKYRIPPNSTGSAVVSGGEDVTVVVEHNSSSDGRYNGYTGVSSGGLDSGWGQTGTALYAPLVKYRHGAEDKTSRFYVLNTGAATASVTIYGYTQSGTSAWTLSNTALAPNALWTPAVPATASGQYAARIQASQPLAVALAEEKHATATVYKLQNVLAGGAPSVYVPQVKHNWVNGDFTTLAVQNVGAAGTNVSVTYYPDGGSACSHSAWLNPWGYHVFQPGEAAGCPSAFVGAARVSGGQALAVLVNERGEKGYSGFLGGSQTVILPRVRADGGWWTGVRVMNVDGGSPTGGSVAFYNTDGSLHSSANLSITGGYNSVNLGSLIPSGFNGSAVVTADRPVVAASTRALNGGGSVRTLMDNASNR